MVCWRYPRPTASGFRLQARGGCHQYFVRCAAFAGGAYYSSAAPPEYFPFAFHNFAAPVIIFRLCTAIPRHLLITFRLPSLPHTHTQNSPTVHSLPRSIAQRIYTRREVCFYIQCKRVACRVVWSCQSLPSVCSTSRSKLDPETLPKKRSVCCRCVADKTAV